MVAPTDFTTTWMGNSKISRTLYLIYRWLMFLCSLFLLISDFFDFVIRLQSLEKYSVENTLKNMTVDVLKYFIYLTHWNRILATASMSLDALVISQSSNYHFYQVNPCRKSRLPFSYRLLWSFYTTTITTSLLVIFIYWAFLKKFEQGSPDLQNIFEHGGVGLVAIFDLLITNKPWAIKHVYKGFVFCGLYLIFSYVYFISDGRNEDGLPYIYSALDWRSRSSCILFGMAVCFAITVLHCAVAGLVRLRDYMREAFNDYCMRREQQLEMQEFVEGTLVPANPKLKRNHLQRFNFVED